MIEGFDTVQVWEKEDLLKIPADLNTSVNDLVNEWLEVHGSTDEDERTKQFISLSTAFRQHKSRPKANCFIKFNLEFSEIFLFNYQKRNIRPFPKRRTIINPDVVVEERKKRDIIARDVQIEYPMYKIADVMNWLQGKAKPKLDFLISFTTFLQDLERDLLDLPPSKGVRWDLDEWRRTANIPIKHSWEEEHD